MSSLTHNLFQHLPAPNDDVIAIEPVLLTLMKPVVM